VRVDDAACVAKRSAQGGARHARSQQINSNPDGARSLFGRMLGIHPLRN
jgi:hypothetical protein